jgi:uncharacterized repeat protein (TIGR02543 family)
VKKFGKKTILPLIEASIQKNKLKILSGVIENIETALIRGGSSPEDFQVALDAIEPKLSFIHDHPKGDSLLKRFTEAKENLLVELTLLKGKQIYEANPDNFEEALNLLKKYPANNQVQKLIEDLTSQHRQYVQDKAVLELERKKRIYQDIQSNLKIEKVKNYQTALHLIQDIQGYEDVDSLQTFAAKKLKELKQIQNKKILKFSLFTLVGMILLSITSISVDRFVLRRYEVQFNANGGNPIESVFLNFGKDISEPNILPYKEGHSFDGWYTDTELTEPFDFGSMPANDITVYAKWTINQYTITFNTNGGNTISTQANNFGSPLVIPTPTKVGHAFVGWFTDGNLTQSYTATATMPAQNLTLYAKWTIIMETLSLAQFHSSTLSTTGRIYLWGLNSNGQLGDGTTTDRNIPTEITSRFSLAAGDKITSLSLGFYHSSALSTTGRVFMWGLNSNGQLGNGTTANRNVPTEITSRFSLAAGDRIISLSLGAGHSSALSAMGRVFMWGYNSNGQLGNGTTANRIVPTEITSRFSLAAGDRIISLSLSGIHSSALSTTGRVYLWGFNQYGQLGDGTTIDRNVPTEITSRFSLAAGDKITSLSLGVFHSSALSTTGRVFMWGDNREGQLGNGTTTDRNVPIQITSRFSLTAGDRIISLSLGAGHSSALSATGRVYLWGLNSNGQLGNGTTTDRNVPTEITSRFSLTAGDKITSLSLGVLHSSALSTTGRVYLWGLNSNGQLGDGTTTDINTPVVINNVMELT